MMLGSAIGAHDAIDRLLQTHFDEIPPENLEQWVKYIIQEIKKSEESQTKQGKRTIQRYDVFLEELKSKKRDLVWEKRGFEAQEEFAKLLKAQAAAKPKSKHSIWRLAAGISLGLAASMGLANKLNEPPKVTNPIARKQIYNANVWKAASKLNEERKAKFLLAATRLLHLMPIYDQAERETGTPATLSLAITTQESKGDSTAKSPTGPVGSGQFERRTAELYFENVPEPGETSTFENDDRLHGSKSAIAIAKYMVDNLRAFAGYRNGLAFAIAQYNGGPLQIREAIARVAQAKNIRPQDAKWADVADTILELPEEYPMRTERLQIINDTLGNPKMTPRIRPAETVKYVAEVLAYYKAWEEVKKMAGGIAVLANYPKPSLADD
jgi:soluble lytic murein transglycosylase-like protein